MIALMSNANPNHPFYNSPHGSFNSTSNGGNTAVLPGHITPLNGQNRTVASPKTPQSASKALSVNPSPEREMVYYTTGPEGPTESFQYQQEQTYQQFSPGGPQMNSYSSEKMQVPIAQIQPQIQPGQQQQYPSYSYYQQAAIQAPPNQYATQYIYIQQPGNGGYTNAPGVLGQPPPGPVAYVQAVVPNGISLAQARHKSKQSTTWSPKEDKLLRELKEIQKLGWREISTFFHDRTPNACQFRWRRIISGTSSGSNSSQNLQSLRHQRTRSGSLSSTNSSSDGCEEKESHHSIKFLLN
ncbi:uncharacterized protein RJT20DRAFT_3898 [Scheffersomyces xylosifermentans]|uniref:uncharacterized protein n=1 Tax=Scheffersomyces xylosifermentans TaxID=1304137 RepID=UPI00315C62CD